MSRVAMISWNRVGVGVDLGYESFCDDLFCDINTIHNLDRDDMRELLTLAAYESFSIFHQIMYTHIDGFTTGSPFDPILANAFLCRFEKQWLAE